MFNFSIFRDIKKRFVNQKKIYKKYCWINSAASLAAAVAAYNGFLAFHLCSSWTKPKVDLRYI
jgi:hypothetical protein